MSCLPPARGFLGLNSDFLGLNAWGCLLGMLPSSPWAPKFCAELEAPAKGLGKMNPVGSSVEFPTQYRQKGFISGWVLLGFFLPQGGFWLLVPPARYEAEDLPGAIPPAKHPGVQETVLGTQTWGFYFLPTHLQTPRLLSPPPTPVKNTSAAGVIPPGPRIPVPKLLDYGITEAALGSFVPRAMLGHGERSSCLPSGRIGVQSPPLLPTCPLFWWDFWNPLAQEMAAACRELTGPLPIPLPALFSFLQPRWFA